MTKILIVDDNRSIRRILTEILTTRKYTVQSVESGRACLEIITRESFDLILLDIKMQGIDGLEVLKALNQMNLNIPIIMMSAHGRSGTAKEVMLMGAFNYIQKPFDAHALLLMVADALEGNPLPEFKVQVPNESKRPKVSKLKASKMIGSSPKFLKMKIDIETTAKFDFGVLIQGPNGAGKELVAHAIHQGSPRRNKRFVEVNCAAIPSELIESILFGHMKGAFTGANKETVGLFEQAQGGTLFLDEIGDMSYTAQAKILKAIEDKKITKVGGSREIAVDVRVISATNQNLEEMMLVRTFREDLYYRLKECVITVPSLNERKADIPELVNHFIYTISKRIGCTPPAIKKEAMDILQQKNYPGNIRQLQNIVKRLLVVSGQLITVTDINKVMPVVVSQQREIIEMCNLVRKLGGVEAAIDFIQKNYR